MTVEKHSRFDEGIPLSHVWHAIVRYRAMIVAMVAGSVLAGVALIYILPAKYEAVAKIRVGQISGMGLLEEPGSLNSRILAEYGIDSEARESPEQPYVRTAQVRRGTTDVVELVAVGASSNAARELLKRVYENISEDHRRSYDAGLEVMKAALADVEESRANLSRTYKELDALIKDPDGRNSIELGLLVMQQGQIGQIMVNLDARVPDLVANMLPPRTSTTTLLGSIVASDIPASPQKLVVLAIMAFLGVMVGIAAAVIRASLFRPDA